MEIVRVDITLENIYSEDRESTSAEVVFISKAFYNTLCEGLKKIDRVHCGEVVNNLLIEKEVKITKNISDFNFNYDLDIEGNLETDREFFYHELTEIANDKNINLDEELDRVENYLNTVFEM